MLEEIRIIVLVIAACMMVLSLICIYRNFLIRDIRMKAIEKNIKLLDLYTYEEMLYLHLNKWKFEDFYGDGNI